MVLSEFLAALGFRDNFTGPFNQTMQAGEKSLGKFKNATVKQFALAGTAVIGFLSLATIGIAKFTVSLVEKEQEFLKFAKGLNQSTTEARKTKLALDTMGKSMEEIKADPALLQQFKELRENAEHIQIPDLSPALEKVKEFQGEYLKLKQTVTVGIQWTGYYFLKHIQQPLAKFQNMMRGFNEKLNKAIPMVASGVGKIFAWIVRIGMRLIEGVGQVWKVIKRLFDLIPDKLKIIGLALLALNQIMKMGPFGIFVTLITLALLLLDDFYTYLEGGESFFASFWEKLVNYGAIENWKSAWESVKTAFSNIMTALDDLIMALFPNADGFLDLIETFLAWLIGTALPKAIGFIADVAGTVAEAINWFLKIPGVIEVIRQLIGLLILWKLKTKAVEIATKAVVLAEKLMAAANPAFLIIAGIIALITVIYLLAKNWDKVTEFFRETAERIKGFFAGIGEWFTNKFHEAGEGIKNVFGRVVTWFQTKVDAIKSFFRGIPSAAKSAITDTVNNIKNIFSPLVDWFREKTDAIKGFFTGIGDKVKGAVGKVGEFFSGGEDETGHADGGIFSREHVARFAEGNQPEAVVPLTKPNRAMEILAGIGEHLGLKGNIGDPTAMVQGLQSLSNKIDGSLGIIAKNIQSVQSVPATAPSYSTQQSSNNINQTNNITVNDTSGNPQATGRAVEQNQKMVIRNLEGLLV